jgi:chromosome transmission fidelity protein 8
MPIMILGHHILYGKVTNMDKPFVLLRKNVKKIENLMDEDEENINQEMCDDNSDQPKTRTEYLVEAVIKRKILFNKRPRPIVYLDNSVNK